VIPRNNAGLLGSAATLHAALSVPNVAMMEAPWANGARDPKVAKPFPKVVDGYALPLEKPGLGIEFDEVAARNTPFAEPPMQPCLKGNDGSVRDF